MDPTAAELPPGCLVLLLRLSAGMTADVVTGRGESVAFASARFLADELLEGLVNTAASYAIGEIDVAVLGYRTTRDGSPLLFSLLPDGDPKPRLVPLSRIADMPAETRTAEGQPRKWAVLPPCEGDPCAGEALASIHLMVGIWLTGRYTNRPPVVIHCTGADGLDDAYFRVARSLSLLNTGYGPVRLLHYVFDNQGDQGPLLSCWDQLQEVSAELPENTDAGKPARRGVWVNDWDLTDQWDAIFSYTWREDTVAWVEAGAGFSRSWAMWTQKMGNTPEQWEDAFAVDAANGVAAVADGASTGIYCRTWADQLSTRFLSDRPDTRDPISLNNWVNGLRTEWRSAINYSNLNWSKQAKVDQVGAAATLLGLELGPPDAEGNRVWRACAVGDASLFWIRGGKLLASFPVVAADQFGSAPLLVRSNPGFKTLVVHAAGTCQPADRFVLATDAVAARMFKSSATGPGPDWNRFEHITEDDWRAELDTLRSANDMVNDDCTLVVLRVSGSAEDEVIETPIETPISEASEQVSTRVAEVEEVAPHPEPQSGSDLSPTGRGEGDATSQSDPVAEENTSLRLGEVADGASAQSVGEGQPEQQETADTPATEFEHEAPKIEYETPNTDHESPPAAQPPAARDGFPESTDPRD
jgi:hypothetical protein